MAEDAAALLLGGPAPHAVTLAVDQGVLQARLTHQAAGTDGLGLPRVLLRCRIEDGGVEPSAGRILAPREIHSLDHFLQSPCSKRVNQASVPNNPGTAGEITPPRIDFCTWGHHQRAPTYKSRRGFRLRPAPPRGSGTPRSDRGAAPASPAPRRHSGPAPVGSGYGTGSRWAGRWARAARPRHGSRRRRRPTPARGTGSTPAGCSCTGAAAPGRGPPRAPPRTACPGTSPPPGRSRSSPRRGRGR